MSYLTLIYVSSNWQKESAKWLIFNKHTFLHILEKFQLKYVRALNSQKVYTKIKWEHYKFQPATSLQILFRF